MCCAKHGSCSLVTLCEVGFDYDNLLAGQFLTLTLLVARRARTALSINNGHRRLDGCQPRAAAGVLPASASICKSRREKSTGLAW